MNWDWIPGVRVGPFFFGAPLPHVEDVELCLLEPDYEDADWQTYRVGDEEARVSVRDGVVTDLECTKSLKYLGRSELLGLSTTAVEALLGKVLVQTEQWDDGTTMYEVESLGLTLWIEGERVESATVEAVEAQAD